jgi:hypothetical protein
MGRFLSPDPILQNDLRLLNPQRWNKYSYAINNPLTLTDPTGKDAAYVNFSGMASGFGHGGILSIHPGSGSATYSRFGPMKAGQPAGAGEVQTDHELPSVQFGANGLPTPASYAALIQAVAQYENVSPDTVGIDYFKTTDAETTNLDQYIQQRQVASDAGKAPNYCFIGSSCRDYALGGMVAGGAVDAWRTPFMSVVPNTLLNQLSGLADRPFRGQAFSGTGLFGDRRTNPPFFWIPNHGRSLTTLSHYPLKAPIFPYSRLIETLQQGWMAVLGTDDATRHQPCK